MIKLPNNEATLLKLRGLLSVVVLCLLIVLCCSQVRLGFLLLLAVPFVAIWLIYSVVVIWRKPDMRKWQAAKIVAWLITFLIVGTCHRYYAEQSRHDVQVISSALEVHKKVMGDYPPKLDAMGERAVAIGRKWRVHYRREQIGEPTLFYPATWGEFSFYRYDFTNHSWRLQGD